MNNFHWWHQRIIRWFNQKKMMTSQKLHVKTILQHCILQIAKFMRHPRKKNKKHANFVMSMHMTLLQSRCICHVDAQDIVAKLMHFKCCLSQCNNKKERLFFVWEMKLFQKRIFNLLLKNNAVSKMQQPCNNVMFVMHVMCLFCFIFFLFWVAHEFCNL